LPCPEFMDKEIMLKSDLTSAVTMVKTAAAVRPALP